MVAIPIACWAPQPAPAGIDFVDGGLVVDGGVGAGGVPLSAGREYVARAWTPGEEVEIVGRTGRAVGLAPEVPVCVELFRLDTQTLGPVSFSADGAWLSLADGQQVEGWSGVRGVPGELNWRSETLAKLPEACAVNAPILERFGDAVGQRRVAVIGPQTDGGYQVVVFR